jgi:hypothetical protein
MSKNELNENENKNINFNNKNINDDNQNQYSEADIYGKIYTNPYKTSNEDLEYLSKKRKSDGSLMLSRIEMINNYNNSYLPYPLSAFFNLTYCKNIMKSHIYNCLFFAFPLSSVAAYTFNSEIRKKGFMSKTKLYYLSIYIVTYSCLLGFFTADALLFCDYCKPWSCVYLNDSRTQKYKEVLKGRIKGEQKSTDIKIQKTRDQGLKDNEI